MENTLSKQRLNSYLREGESNLENAIGRYKWNIKLSQSLYPSLSLVEVALRNHLDMGLSEQFGSDWINHSFLGSYHADQIKESKNNLLKNKRVTNKEDIIASLTFGFWTSFFYGNYRKIYLDGKILKTAFPKIPNFYRDREKLNKLCESIKNLRNRVFHHEPIYNIRDLLQKVYDIENLLSWMNEDILFLKRELCTFEDVYWNQAPASEKYFAIIKYNPKQRNSLLNFLVNEISELTNKKPAEIKYKCDAIIKSALSNRNKIRLAYFKSEIVGVLFLEKNSAHTLLASANWKSCGVFKWFIDFSKERYKENLFLHCFEKDLKLEEIILEKKGQFNGNIQHPILTLPINKFVIV
jgi:hypothetical protein